MNRQLQYSMIAAIAIAALPTVVVTGQDTSKSQTVTTIGKAPSLPDETAKKKDSPPTSAYFSDSFSGTQLAPEWKVVNGDAQGWVLQTKPKSLLIITHSGSLKDSKNLKNWLLLSKALPADDYEVIVEAAVQIQGVGNSVGFALFGDDQNYFWVDFQGDAWGNNIARTPYFSKEFQGKSTSLSGERRFGTTTDPEHIFLKIERQGNQYSGFYAYADKPMKIEEIPWVKMGTLPWINFSGKLALVGVNYQDAPEVSAEFYAVLILKK